MPQEFFVKEGAVLEDLLEQIARGADAFRGAQQGVPFLPAGEGCPTDEESRAQQAEVGILGLIEELGSTGQLVQRPQRRQGHLLRLGVFQMSPALPFQPRQRGRVDTAR